MGDKCHNGIVDSDDVDNVSSVPKICPSSGSSVCRMPGSSCQALRHAVAALSRLDDFICEKIGSGFFSEVFKVRHRTTGQVMVLKMNMSHSNRSNMLREVQLMNRLSHPNILRFMGVCVHEGQLHALTEYLNGGSLEQLILNKKEELSWSARIKLALDIARGMSYLHSRGVFHRDLTSKNVLVKKDGNELTAVVGDFGLAERIPDLRHKNQRLPIVGSPYWMAPECLHGQWYNQMADVFSYGIILCEMIGRIEADPDVLPRTENFGVDYVAFSKLCPSCPFQFLTLAFSCCAIDPKNRPSFKEIVHQLEIFLVDTIDGSYVLQNKVISPSYDDADSIDHVQAIFAHWHKRSVEIPISECEENYLKRREENRKSIEGPGVVPVTALHIGEFMSQQDPHYKPNSTTQNPFATLTCFNGGKKILGESNKSGESDISLSCSFELPSPSCALTPPGTPVTPDELLCSSSGHRRASSHSLPASPTLLRRTLVRMHSGRSDLSVDPAAVSPHSISPEPPSSISSTSPTETEENPFLTSIRSNTNSTSFSSLQAPANVKVSLSAKACCSRGINTSNGHCSDDRGVYNSGSSLSDDAVSWCGKQSKKTDNFLSPPEISSRFASGRKRPSSYHSDDSGCSCSGSSSTTVYIKETERKTKETITATIMHANGEQSYAETSNSVHTSSDVSSIQPDASSLCETNDVTISSNENASVTMLDNCTFNGGLKKTMNVNRTAKLLRAFENS